MICWINDPLHPEQVTHKCGRVYVAAIKAPVDSGRVDSEHLTSVTSDDSDDGL